MDLFDEQVTGDAHLHELAGQLGRLAGVRAANVLIMEPTVVVTGSSGAHMKPRCLPCCTSTGPLLGAGGRSVVDAGPSPARR